jgi:hypothetical protein
MNEVVVNKFIDFGSLNQLAFAPTCLSAFIIGALGPLRAVCAIVKPIP